MAPKIASLVVRRSSFKSSKKEAEIDSFSVSSSIVSSIIKEGDEVSIKCVVDSNLPVNQVEWTMNGQSLTVNDTLILSPVDRSHESSYACIASNQAGKSRPAVIDIKVTCE